MEKLPADLCLKIFGFFDHQNLSTAQLVCRKWRDLASENTLWSNLFIDRWGIEQATFYAPEDSSKSWNDIYIVQDRCDRVGLGLKIIREGDDYLLVHQGEIQRHLGSRSMDLFNVCRDEEKPCLSISDKILFFIGDLEVASAHAKRSRMM